MSWNCTAYFLDARALLLTECVIVLCKYAAHTCSFNCWLDYSSPDIFDLAYIGNIVPNNNSIQIVLSFIELLRQDNISTWNSWLGRFTDLCYTKQIYSISVCYFIYNYKGHNVKSMDQPNKNNTEEKQRWCVEHLYVIRRNWIMCKQKHL